MKLALQARVRLGMEAGEIFRWTATVTGVVAAMMVSFDFGRRVTGYGFAVFVVSSVCWVISGVLAGMPSLYVLNGVLFVINCIGVYRWLIRKRPPSPAEA